MTLTMPYKGLPDREAYLQDKITSIAEEAFPEHPGRKWAIYGYEHRGSITTVEVTSQFGKDIRSRFKLAHEFGPSGTRHNIACHKLEGGRWTLLFKDPAYDSAVSSTTANEGAAAKPLHPRKSKAGSLLFSGIGGLMLASAWHLLDRGTLPFGKFFPKGVAPPSMQGNPFYFWTLLGVIGFVGTCFFLGGLRSLFRKPRPRS